MAMNHTYFDSLRDQMLQDVAAHARLAAGHTGRGRLSERVLQAMAAVPRHEFVPAELQMYAYADTPLPIGYDKTISQPFIVALMTDLLDVGPADRVLEVGTGLGYQAAVLAELSAQVYSIEIIEELARNARRRLDALGYDMVETTIGDGSHGWPEHAPYDRILVAAAPDLIPPALLQQLKPGGRMVIPAGLPESQKLMVVERDSKGTITTQELLAVRFAELEMEDQPSSC